jgi:uncharacterized protein (TIGR02001 family)
MKKILSTAIATTLAATGLMATTAAFTTASADMAYNVGVMSQYVFRGMVQRGGASLMGGADYTNDSGLYAGVWAAQVGTEATTSLGSNNGLEVDLYGGIKKEMSGVTLGAGFTSYQYTNKISASKPSGFDTAYNELNFSLAYGPITATVNPGYHEGFNGSGDKSYVFYSIKGEYEGFYALYGAFDKKAEATKGAQFAMGFDGLKDGSYVQAGYKTSLGGLDIDAYLVNSSKELNTVGSDAGTSSAYTAAISATKAF